MSAERESYENSGLGAPAMKRGGLIRLRIVSCSASILLMAAIFFFSSQTAGESSKVSGSFIELIAPVLCPGFGELGQYSRAMIVDGLQSVVRTCAHGAVFFALGISVTLTLYTFDLRIASSFVKALLICILYAVSDEIHQHFVPGRTMQAIDIVVDGCGALLGSAAASLLIFASAKKIKNG